MDTGADCRRHAAEFLVYAEREPEREAHFISMAETWLRLANQAERIQALTDQRGPLFPEIQTWTFANLAQNGNGSALAQLRPVTRERG